MSLIKLCMVVLSYVFLGSISANAMTEADLDKTTKKIERYTTPKYRNTFMSFSSAEIQCLALNIYHEARNESLSGKVAVILVTLNRVADKRFPNTICGVVRQGKHFLNLKDNKFYPKKDRCQFSWYCDGLSDKPNNKKAWVYSIALTRYFLTRSMMIIDFTEGATHYHADYVNPRWASQKDFIKTVQIDTHKFYRWQG